MENIARFGLDTHLIPPLTKYNAVMEFVLSEATDDTIIAANFVFPTKIKDAVGIRDPMIKVSNLSCEDMRLRFKIQFKLLFTLLMI